MKIGDLVTHYVAFRRALGSRFRDQEYRLRSFCRAVEPETPISYVRREDVVAFLAGDGPVKTEWFKKHEALNGFFRFAISRGTSHRSPAADGPANASSAVRPVHLLPRGTPPVTGCDTVMPAGPPHPH